MFKKIDSIRGIAAILVVLYHSPFYLSIQPSSFWSNAYLFVDLFFVLSGFVMTYTYQNKIGVSINFVKFILLRLGRLYPLHLFILCIWIIFVLFKWYFYSKGYGNTNPFVQNNVSTFIENLFLVHAIGWRKFASWNYPSWSISVEFYTYAIFFAYIYMFKKRFWLASPLIISILVYILLISLAGSRTLDFPSQFGFPRCIAAFFAGVFLLRLSNYINWQIPKGLPINIAEIISIILVFIFIKTAHKNAIALYMSIISFLFSLYVFSMKNSGFTGKLLLTHIPVYIGKYSYSIYMWNAIVISIFYNIALFVLKLEKVNINQSAVTGFVSPYAFAVNILILLVLFALSSVTYKYIEVPWRNKIRNFVFK